MVSKSKSNAANRQCTKRDASSSDQTSGQHSALLIGAHAWMLVYLHDNYVLQAIILLVLATADVDQVSGEVSADAETLETGEQTCMVVRSGAGSQQCD